VCVWIFFKKVVLQYTKYFFVHFDTSQTFSGHSKYAKNLGFFGKYFLNQKIKKIVITFFRKINFFK